MIPNYRLWLPLLVYASILVHVSAALIQSDSPLKERDDKLRGPRIAVLGDSYGSGLAYLDSNRYHGNNADGCYRWDKAYAAQLEAEPDVEMQFLACTGAQLVNMAKEGPQIDKVKGEVDLIVLTIGGNNALFFEVAANCIFHPLYPHDYGPNYPDPAGACFQSIQKSRTYIRNRDETAGKSLGFDIRATYDNLLEKEPYRSQPHTYHTGYVHFFNTDKEGDWCEESKESFAVFPCVLPRYTCPPLTNAMRSDINQLVEEWNSVLKGVTADYAAHKFSYVEVSDRFNGHRFCEKGSEHKKQYYDDSVWLWNVSPPLPDGVVLDGDDAEPLHDVDQLMKFAETGLWNSTSTVNRDYFAQSSSTGAGWTLRPFHPKKDGYSAFKDAIVAKMKEDKIVGVKS